MARTTKAYEKEILEVIEKNEDICFITEIFIIYSGCCRDTFYNHGLDKFDTIKSALEENRAKIKKKMRGNWQKKYASPALQIAAYKLMGTDEERKRLSQTYIELTGQNDGPIKTVTLDPEKYADIRKRMLEEDDC